MASAVLNTSQFAPRPALATTYEGGGLDLLERIAPLVDYLEIPPDSISRTEAGRSSLQPEILDRIASVTSQVGLIVHGIGLSIGSFDQWNEPYLHLLDEFFSSFTPQ